MNPGEISILDYSYDLPPERIAMHPLKKRDDSKLLVYKNGSITASAFSGIGDYLSAGTMLVFNNTRVINARLVFTKDSGGRIEIFCLEPMDISGGYENVMLQRNGSQWKCFVGGASKWKESFIEKKCFVGSKEVTLHAEQLFRDEETWHIKFSWNDDSVSFAEILQSAGVVPLPPYIKREADTDDLSEYQTVYAKHEGSVAAPTAGLHFTPELLEELRKKNISQTFVTLHVGAGTFKPVKAATMKDHEMHAEYIDVERSAVESLKNNEQVAAVGTTSLRTIETLYWLGVKVLLDPTVKKLELLQWDVYGEIAKSGYTAQESLRALLNWMEVNNQQRIFTKTQLMIVPGYTFRVAKILVTNFHQPQSTLLLLVAAAIGNDWKKMYDHAMEHDFRFLSYGDGNLIYINKNEGNNLPDQG